MKYQGKITDPKDLVTKEYADGRVVANPTLAGTESDLTALQVGGTKYKVPSGGGVATLAVTVTNGTATSVTATKGGESVSLTYSGGVWTTILPSFGTWTVTITDGTHSNTATVSASTAGIYAVSIFLPDVPSAYTQLEYLQSSKTQYINTGLNISGGGRIKTRFAYSSETQAEQNNAVMGVEISGTPYNNLLLRYQGPYDNTIRFACYGLAVDTTFTAGKIYDVDALFDSTNKAITVSFNGTATSQTGGTRVLATLALSLFGVNVAGDTMMRSAIKLYSFEYTAANAASPTAKYVPAKRNSDSVLGMYDTATNTFKTNAGTGTFIAGPAV